MTKDILLVRTIVDLKTHDWIGPLSVIDAKVFKVHKLTSLNLLSQFLVISEVVKL